MGVDVVTLSLAKTYANKLSCGITTQDRLVLDNIEYDRTDETLKVNGEEVLTKKDAVSDDDNLNFDGWFD